MRVVDAKELVAGTSATNRGVIYNNLVMIRALLESKLPSGASMSRQSAWAVGRIIKNNPTMSAALRDYLSHLKLSLEENTNSMSTGLAWVCLTPIFPFLPPQVPLPHQEELAAPTYLASWLWGVLRPAWSSHLIRLDQGIRGSG